MGTNYYRKPILTKERKEKLHKLVDEGKLHCDDWKEEENPESCLTSYVHYLSEGIHICKTSCGWYTCFDHNWGKYYQPNRKSLEEFLSEDGYEIEDEYGRKYTPEEFWAMVDERDRKPGLWDSESYDRYERERDLNWRQYRCTDDIKKCETVFGIHTDSNDFKVDGLRFAVFSDFG